MDDAESNGYISIMATSMDARAEKLFDDLNDPQREAVAHTDGPLLILAGPGSGKTRVITRRAAHLANTVTRPRHVLAITFTNKAAREMRERIASLEVGPGITATTFHALCAMILRRHAERIGIPKNFTIFDRDDRRKIVKQAIDRCNLGSDRWSPAMVDSVIGRHKNAMVTAADAASLAADWHAKTIARIYECYEGLLKENGGLDFDDLLLYVARALDRDAELRADLEDHYRYVLVDEYQDTNGAQYLIARQLTRQNGNLCATGDPDQSIYGWRGANIENILAFERDYPNARVVRLEENYRSTQRILSAADRLIAENQKRKAKSLWTKNGEGSRVRVIEVEDGDEEAREIALDIKRLTMTGVSLGEIAVFYRINSLSRAMEEALIREGVRYQIARGVEFYSRKEIKDVLAYLRVLINPADEVALIRIINTPTRGIGDTSIDRLRALGTAAGQRLFDVLCDESKIQHIGRAAGKVRDFANLIQSLRPTLELRPSEALSRVIADTGLRAMYSSEKDLDDAPIENLNELISAAAEYEEEFPEATVATWLEHTSLLSDVDSVDDQSGSVTLMTLHAAKGLEFPHVYVIALEEGILPMRRDDDQVDEEEERRLLFVGITRAQKRLTLSRAKYRMIRGITERTVRSPFLDELPTDELEYVGEKQARATPRKPKPDLGRLPADISQWSTGTLVRHPAHGLGQVMALHRGDRRTHVDVLFKDGQRRSWVLEFAQLERVDYDEIG